MIIKILIAAYIHVWFYWYSTVAIIYFFTIQQTHSFVLSSIKTKTGKKCCVLINQLQLCFLCVFKLQIIIFGYIYLKICYISKLAYNTLFIVIMFCGKLNWKVENFHPISLTRSYPSSVRSMFITIFCGILLFFNHHSIQICMFYYNIFF